MKVYLSSRRYQSQKLLMLIMAWLAITVLEWAGVLGSVTKLGQKTCQPLLATAASVTQAIVSPIKRLFQLSNSAKRVQELEQLYSESLAQLSELDNLKKENQALREVLENSDREYSQQALSRPIVSFGSPVVSAGQADGIEVGAVVLASQTLIGRVSQVSEYQSQVTLLSQTSEPILAKTDTGVEGVVVGDGRKIVFKEIAIEAEVNPGQRVNTIGQNGIAPGIFIGQIQQVKVDHSSPVKSAVVTQLVNFYDAGILEVRK